MSSRRKAREAVLKILYLSESRKISYDSAFFELSEIDREIEESPDDDGVKELKPFSLGLDDKQKEFAQNLVHYIADSGKKIKQYHRTCS